MFTIKLDEQRKELWKLPLVADYVKKWADITPDAVALMSADSGKSYTYREFDEMITLYALRLKEMGVKKGDVIATQWLSTPEFFMLTYACATVGAIISPLDIRLQVSEIIRDMNKISPVAFFCMGKTPLRDFTEVSAAVQGEVKSLKYIIQHTPGAPEEAVSGSVKKFGDLFSEDKLKPLADDSALTEALLKEYRALDKRDPHIIIFTTGTTGFPKPALICNENTITNNGVFSREVGLWGSASRYLNSMPTSHVAGTCQGPMTVWLTGGTVVTVNVYQPELILKYIEKWRPTWWGGVPTMFHMMWQMPSYKDYDLSSLLYVLYGGSAVDTAFLTEMQKMAPSFGTALGMTECAGYFTATPKAIPLDEMAGQVGQVFPELAPVTIRKPMNEDGTAGEELPQGEVGDICVHGPIVFLGYYNDPDATATMISKEGILYTGDMGYFHDFGAYRGLKFAGRRKFVIKPKGYLVFPDEVGDFITQHPRVAQALVVGLPHKTNVDGVFAYVVAKPGEKVTPEEVMEHCKGLAGYKRPLHVELWPEGKTFHVNRVGKIDVPAMIKEAEPVVEKLKSEGKWD
ncbi:MAG TPA: class I adenylate-forming enzyme family protein [Spirochaetota bacterium]|nr:class I adenylate-forming enzyme family protein [Spirochaetota bacterium]HPJ34951.1 class I adenylate-forming enzyme family protein [Spirochaetota bacterium]